MVPIASAGNAIDVVRLKDDGATEVVAAALDFPFAPGAWKGVVSVSAADPDYPSRRAGNSNAGEVMLNGNAELSEDKELKGTSFATPRLAAMTARLLAAHPEWSKDRLPTLPSRTIATGAVCASWPPLDQTEFPGQFGWLDLTPEIAHGSLCDLYPALLGTVEAASLNLRSQPNTSGSVLQTLPRGTTVHIDCWVKGEDVKGNATLLSPNPY